MNRQQKGIEIRAATVTRASSASAAARSGNRFVWKATSSMDVWDQGLLSMFAHLPQRHERRTLSGAAPRHGWISLESNPAFDNEAAAAQTRRVAEDVCFTPPPATRSTTLTRSHV